MVLNDLGKIAEECWLDIPKHYIESELDEYIIMPNHIHGIIIIDYDNVGKGHPENTGQVAPSLQQNNKKHNLGNIIGSFKSAVSQKAHEKNYKNFSWQSSFYDRVIRNESELFNIRKYIQQNPLKWDLEKGVDNLEI